MKTDKNGLTGTVRFIWDRKDVFWFLIWSAGIGALFLWNLLFLNRPAFERLLTAFSNTIIIGALVIFFSLLMGWGLGLLLHFTRRDGRAFNILITFLLNIIRSVPQILGVLAGYFILTFLGNSGFQISVWWQLVWMSAAISLFVFPELTDLISERIEFFSRSDFYPAMLVCGIKERTIVNRDVLLKNSLPHILHKLISLFGTGIFLQCSVDFIISVGLSTEVSLTDTPLTLGGLLARMDSKQDILAIGNLLTDPFYLPAVFFEHLQGISTAVIIVFTLFSVYKISNGFIKRIS